MTTAENRPSNHNEGYLKSQREGDEVFLRLFAAWGLCAIVLEAVDDARYAVFDQRLAYRAENAAAQFIRQDGLINGFLQARAKRRMNAESGVADLLGNGFVGHGSPLWFLAKAVEILSLAYARN